jgi:hypothetical protein
VNWIRICRRRGAAVCVAVAVLVAAGAARAAAQDAPRQPESLARPGVSPGEIQRLFDAYVILQAQQELQLTDAQYPAFVQRMKALLDIRRQTQGERQRLLADIRRLSRAGGGERAAEDAELAARVKELEALRQRAQSDLQRALDEVDQVLDVRQRARFRVFEEQMERRKMELLMRARRNRR